MNDYVKTFAQIGNTIYIGGKFLQVQHGIGGPTFTQSYLAAFDVNTGEWIPTFNPVIDAPVWKIMASPDGTQAVRRRRVHERQRRGEHDRARRARPGHGRAGPEHDLAGLRLAAVERLLRRPRHVHPGPVALPRRQLHQDHRRHRLQHRRPAHRRAAWPASASPTASPTGTGSRRSTPRRMDINASAQGDRVYAVGTFTTLNGATLQPEPPGDRSTRSPARRCPGLNPGMPTQPGVTEPSNTILEVGDHVYQGGSQHYLHSVRPQRLHVRARLHRPERRRRLPGHGVQGRHPLRRRATASPTSSTRTRPTCSHPTGLQPGRPDQPDRRLRHDRQPRGHSPSSTRPSSSCTGSGGEGPWALFFDSNGCMWAGGDLMRQGAVREPVLRRLREVLRPRHARRRRRRPTSRRRVARQRRHAHLERRRPTTRATPIQYEILKDDPTFGTIVVGTHLRPHLHRHRRDRHRPLLRARRGRRPATARRRTPVHLRHPAAARGRDAARARRHAGPTGPTARTSAPPGASPASTPRRGPPAPSQLGWGDKGEATTDRRAVRSPSTSSSTMNIANPSLYSTFTIRLKRDDGAVVYVNGVDGRARQPAGRCRSPRARRPAPSPRATAESTWYEYQVPASLFAAGDNTDRGRAPPGRPSTTPTASSTSSSSPATAARATAPTTPAPTVVGTSTSARSTLSWARVDRRRRASSATSCAATARRSRSRRRPRFVDSGLAPSTTYAYDVTAVDSSGNASTPGAVEHDHARPTPRSSVRRRLVVPGHRHRPGHRLAPARLQRLGVGRPARRQLGWGGQGETTVVPVGTCTQYYVRHFNVDDPSPLPAAQRCG